jgi:hypothetical protein
MQAMPVSKKLPAALAAALLFGLNDAPAQQQQGTTAQRPAAPRRATPQPPPPSRAQYDALQKQLADQQEILENLRRAVGDQDARYRELLNTMKEQEAARQRTLDEVRQREAQARDREREEKAAQEAPRAVQIGTAPPAGADQPMAVAPIFEERGVLTPRGQVVFEPSIQYGYSSSNRAALVGYTVIPAILIGLVDVREVKRNSLTAAVAFRYGLTDRFEVEARLPYVYRSDSTVSREIFTGSATDAAFTTSGRGIGDFEVTARYQLNSGGTNMPYLIGSLRFKSRTGTDPFEVITDCVTRCVSNTTGTGQPLDLPTGSGFYTLQPGLTWLYPSDPAVFFGSFTYGHNFKRDNVSRRVLGGETEFIGEVEPGHVIGMNVGMGLALNDRSSFSIGFDLSSIGRTKQNGATVPGSVRTQLATLVLGYSHRWDEKRTLNMSVGAGLTRDTPDLTLTLRMPFNL